MTAPTKDIFRLHSDHLQTNPRARLGATDEQRVPCAVSPENHGHHPANELCRWCEAPSESTEPKKVFKPEDLCVFFGGQPIKGFTYTPAPRPVLAPDDTNAKDAYERNRMNFAPFAPPWDLLPETDRDAWRAKYPPTP